MNRNNATIRLTAAAAVAALAGLTACSTKPISKAGSTDQHAQAIVLQMPDGSDPDGLYLARDIAKLSHGALKVTIDSKTYNSTSAGQRDTAHGGRPRRAGELRLPACP